MGRIYSGYKPYINTVGYNGLCAVLNLPLEEASQKILTRNVSIIFFVRSIHVCIRKNFRKFLILYIHVFFVRFFLALA